MQYRDMPAHQQPVGRRQKRQIRQEELQAAKQYAKRGHSLSFTAHSLGYYPQQFNKLLEDAGVHNIQFVPGTQSLAFRKHLSHAQACARESNRKRHLRSAFGVTGTVKELKEYFGFKLSINALYKRLRGGMAIEEALTKERMTEPVERETKEQTIMPKEKAIELARGYARRGHSFSFTAQLLGMTNRRLRRLLEEEESDIQFVHGMRSLATQRRLEELHASQRGKSVKPSPAVLAALARGRETRGCKRYTAFGVTGYLSELKKHFNCPIQVKSIRARLARGMSVEDALTMPAKNAVKGLIPPQFQDWINAQRRSNSLNCYAIALSRLTSTMLQYRSSEHNIVETGCDVSSIAVEVRTKTGDVLHRLRFNKNFKSGVLFVFNPNERGRLRFIAFEPDCPALQQDNPAQRSA